MMQTNNQLEMLDKQRQHQTQWRIEIMKAKGTYGNKGKKEGEKSDQSAASGLALIESPNTNKHQRRQEQNNTKRDRFGMKSLDSLLEKDASDERSPSHSHGSNEKYKKRVMKTPCSNKSPMPTASIETIDKFNTLINNMSMISANSF